MWNLLRSLAVHPLGSWAGVRAGTVSLTAPQLPVSACPLPPPFTPTSPVPKAPQPCSSGSSRPKQTWGAGAWSSGPGCRPRTLGGWRRTGPATLPGPGRKMGLRGPPRPLAPRPPPARATVAPVPWVSLKVGKGQLQGGGRWVRVSSPQLEAPKFEAAAPAGRRPGEPCLCSDPVTALQTDHFPGC